MQTFITDLGEVSLQPATGGIFKVHLYEEEPGPTEEDEATIAEYLLWDKKAEGGFPGINISFIPPPLSKPLLTETKSTFGSRTMD